MEDDSRSKIPCKKEGRTGISVGGEARGWWTVGVDHARPPPNERGGKGNTASFEGRKTSPAFGNQPFCGRDIRREQNSLFGDERKRERTVLDRSMMKDCRKGEVDHTLGKTMVTMG